MRATTNHRSLSKEILFLMEVALAVESEQVRETVHLLYKMNVSTEVQPAPLDR